MSQNDLHFLQSKIYGQSGDDGVDVQNLAIQGFMSKKLFSYTI